MTAAPPDPVLIVDDHALFAHGLAMLVQHSLGLQAHIVGSVEAALARLAAGQRYSVALLDLELPGLSGLEGVQRLLAVEPLLPIVVCSSHGADAARQAALGRGARAFVGKGEAPEQLLSAVRRARLGHATVAEGAAAPGRGDALTARQREVLWLVSCRNSKLHVSCIDSGTLTTGGSDAPDACGCDAGTAARAAS